MINSEDDKEGRDTMQIDNIINHYEAKFKLHKRQESMKEHLYNTSNSRNYPEFEPRISNFEVELIKESKYSPRGPNKPYWRQKRKKQKKFRQAEKERLIKERLDLKHY